MQLHQLVRRPLHQLLVQVLNKPDMEAAFSQLTSFLGNLTRFFFLLGTSRSCNSARSGAISSTKQSWRQPPYSSHSCSWPLGRRCIDVHGAGVVPSSPLDVQPRCCLLEGSTLAQMATLALFTIVRVIGVRCVSKLLYNGNKMSSYLDQCL